MTSQSELVRARGGGRHVRRRSRFGVACAAVASLAVVVQLGSGAFASAPHFTYTLNTVGPQNGGGEPSIAVSRDHTIYVSAPGDGMEFFRSTDGGQSFTPGAVAESPRGDTSVTTHSSGAVSQS